LHKVPIRHLSSSGGSRRQGHKFMMPLMEGTIS
jgi:hypothetical protein